MRAGGQLHDRRGWVVTGARAGVHTDVCVCADCREEWQETDWSAFRRCRVCRAATGRPCVALSGRVAGGRPDGNPVELDVPHAARRVGQIGH